MQTLDLCAEILKAIAQPTRLRIIELLRDGEHCVCEIYPAIGHEQSNTSRHLQMMLKSGILSQRKDGLKIYYSLRHPEIVEMIDLAGLIVEREAQRTITLLKGTRMFGDDETICWCSRVSAGTIRQAIREGACTVDDIRRMTGACTLGRCKEFAPDGQCCCGKLQQLLGEALQC